MCDIQCDFMSVMSLYTVESILFSCRGYFNIVYEGRMIRMKGYK